MAPYLNGVDHGAAARVLEGVLFEKENYDPDEPVATQPHKAGDEEPVKDGDELKPSTTGPSELGDENKENITPIEPEDEDEGNNEQASLQGKVQVKSEEKPTKKKKKSGKSKTKGAKKRGTGFEDYYCDPPLTPEEAKEEKATIYALDRPFVDRIEECIQRYRARRRMDNSKENLLNKYLNLGGIDTAPRMFQSMDTIKMDEETNDEIRDMTAGDVIHRGGANIRYYDPNDPDNWEVDFSSVAAGFFSERIFKLAGTDLGLIQMAVDVVTNFLNYVLHHDVCPEYTDDIMKAREICACTVDQITRGIRVIKGSPSDFSRACHVLFDVGDNSFFEFDAAADGMSKEHAQRIFFASVAAHDALYAKVNGNKIEDIKVIDQVTQTFEVEQVTLPAEEQINGYLGVKDEKGVPGNIKPCGWVTLKSIDLVSGWDKGDSTGPARGIDPQETFVLDTSVLEHLTPGMKLKVVVSVLNIGVKFIKDVLDVRPKFYTFLPQELMLRYREPVPNDRPAPSTEHPDMDEGGNGEDKDEFAD